MTQTAGTATPVPGLDPFVLELREFHKQGLEKIHQEHRTGAGGLRVVELTTGLMDQVVIRAWRNALESVTLKMGADLSKSPPQIALIATGGYGRAQLNPRSDVDILFLYKSTLSEVETEIIKKTLQTLWDTGIELGHSTRNWADCVRGASEDLTTRTSLLENRFIAGDRGIHEKFHRKYRARVARFGIQDFIRQKEMERQARYRRYGDTVALQEPNIKESAGGLRDLHHAIWVGIAMYDTPTLEGIRRRGLVGEPFYGELVQAVDFILRVRNDLHLTVGTSSNLLNFEVQEIVAKSLGFSDEGVNLAEENLMQHYYSAATRIQQFADLMTIRCLRPNPLRRVAFALRKKQVGEGFVLKGGQLTVEHPETFFLNRPDRAVRLFELLQRYGCALEGELYSELVQYLTTATAEDIVASKECRETLVQLLTKPGRVGPVIRAFYETGFLDVVIPEFKVIRFLPRRDLYHKYTVDEHSIITVEILDALAEEHAPEEPALTLEQLASRYPATRRMWRWWGVKPIEYRNDPPETDEPEAPTDVHTLPLYSQTGERILSEIKEIYAGIPKPELLYLATFLHDIGKGRGGNHHIKGAAIACEVCRRLGMNEPDTDLVIFLVEKHLEFARIAFRFDTRDSGTVQQFASWCNTREKLDCLYLLTLADTWAVSTDLLTEWKLSMLHQFYLQVREYLDDRYQAELKRSEKQRKAYQEFIATLPRDITEQEAERHLGHLPRRIITQHTPDQLHFQIRLLRRYTGERPVVGCRQTMMNLLEVVTLCPSRVGRFMRVVRALSSLNLSVMEARLFNRDDGVGISTVVVMHREGAAFHEDIKKKIEERTVLSLEDKWDESWNPKTIQSPAPKKVRFKPHVEVYNRVSPQFTVIEVRCADEIGVLLKITTVLAKYGLDICVARIHTEEKRVFDTFYVLDMDRRKFEDPQKINWLKASLVKALEND